VYAQNISWFYNTTPYSQHHEFVAGTAIVIPCVGTAGELGVNFDEGSQNPYHKNLGRTNLFNLEPDLITVLF
jgi:hypothetical protein